MCLVTNEGRAPARTAGPPLRLPRRWPRHQVAGEGAAAEPRGEGAGGARAGPPACGRGSAAEAPAVGISVTPFSCPARKEGRSEGRKRGRRGLSGWKVQAEAPSPCGCTGRGAAPGGAG